MNVLSALLLTFTYIHKVSGASFPIMWEFQEKPSFEAAVGDVIEFNWTSGFHDVHLHPSMSCDETGAVALYSPATSGGFYSYTILDEDAGSSLFFSCDIGAHCEGGVFLVVNVSSIEVDGNGSSATHDPTNTPSPTISMEPSLSASPTETIFVEYYDSPELKWSVQLSNTNVSDGSGIGPGNAVAVSPDGNGIYVTMTNGRLDVLSSSSGDLRFSFFPPALDPGWTTVCKSGVTFSEFSGVKYAIFPVIDVPPPGSIQDFKSRIVCVSRPDNRVLWISDSIPGEIQGKLLVTESARFPGEFILFTHNQLNMTSAELYGSASMVVASSGVLVWTEDAGDNLDDPDPSELLLLDDLRMPYGPMGVVHFPDDGRFPGGEGNNNDVFVWSTSDQDGQVQMVTLKHFSCHVSFMWTLLENRWNAIASPTLSGDGKRLYFGVRQHGIRAWTQNQYFDLQGNIVVDDLPTNEAKLRTPVPFSPVLSSSEDKLFVGLTVPTLYALDSRTGEIEWELAGNTSAVVSSPVIASPDDLFIYVTWEDGTILAVSQETGDIAWSISCADIDPEDLTLCIDLVLGESSLSPNGLVFYYGDVTGNVKALQLGFSLFNTTAPTEFPTQKPS